MKRVIYFGNLDYKNGFAAFNRVVGNSIILSKLGFCVDIYLTNICKESIHKNPTLYNRNINLCAKPFGGIKNYYSYKFYLKKIREKDDIEAVFLYNMPSIPFYVILKECKRKNIKVISDTTEWYDTKNFPPFLKIIKKIDTSIRMRSLNKKVDGLILISDFLYNFYKNSHIPMIKVYPIMDYSLGDNCCYSETSSDKHKITFGYIGNNTKGKDDIDTILPIIANNPLLNLIYCGQPSAQSVKLYHKNPNILFLGKMDHAELVEYFKNIDFNIVVRKKTRANDAGFPTKFAESICYGVPVICNDFSDVKNIISKYRCGICLEGAEFKDLTIEDLNVFKQNTKLKEAKKIFLSDRYLDDFKTFFEEISIYKN